MGIYVEIFIRGPMEELWQKTQAPKLHERWDLRFTEIDYLPRPSEAQPQRFLYATRIGFGLAIRGEGESVGEREAAGGQRSSALKFWSEDALSLIRQGSGYWQYIPQAEGVRFLTWYDYHTRFGMLGRALDRLLFRPLMGWATAWSFDRLRLWIERGIDPATALRYSLIHGMARLGVASVWLYQGLVPANPSMPAGWGSILLGLLLLLAWHHRWLLLVSLLSTLLITDDVVLRGAVIALSLVGYLASATLPSARHCLRERPEEQR